MLIPTTLPSIATSGPPELPGLIAAIYSRDGGSLGIGFAIPSEMVMSVVSAVEGGQQDLARGIIRPWLGVAAQTITSDIANSLGLNRVQGVLVAELHPQSPLKNAGIRAGDVISAIDGRAIHDPAEMKFRTATVPLGQTALFKYFRRGNTYETAVRMIKAPDQPPRNETWLEESSPLQGALVSNINPAVISENGLDWNDYKQGVLVLDIRRGSYASRLVRPGDMVVAINGDETPDVDELVDELDDPYTGNWTLTYIRNGQQRQIALR